MVRRFLGILALATPFAGSAGAGETMPRLLSGNYIICVGQNACSQATDEHCSIVLGTNMQFPPHVSHVLVTPKGIWSLQKLDDRVVGMINREAAANGGRPLERWYIEKWNDVCGGISGVPMS